MPSLEKNPSIYFYHLLISLFFYSLYASFDWIQFINFSLTITFTFATVIEIKIKKSNI